MKLNDNFLKLYSDIASDKKCKVIDVLNEDGNIAINDTIDEKYKGVLELHNCMNNPLYFLDKLKINVNDELIPMPIDITGFMSIKLVHTNKNNIVVDHPKGTHVNDLIIGYMMYKLLFTDECIMFYTTDKYSEAKNMDISKLYDNIPKYLKIKPLNELSSRILYHNYDKEQFEKLNSNNINIGLIIYMNVSDLAPSKFLLDTGITTIISNSSGDSRNIKYRFTKDHSGHNFKMLNYDVKTLGYSNEWIKEQFEKLDNNTDRLLKEIFMLYDDMTDEEAESLEEKYKANHYTKSE